MTMKTHERDQLETRSSKRFAELRTHVYEQIQISKASKPTGAVAAQKAPRK